MKLQGIEEKNFGLSEDSFALMVSDLKANDTRFFQKVFLEQFRETMNYIKRELGASQEDAYDATMDALLDMRRLFVEGKLRYGNLRYLFTKMSKQRYLKSINKLNFVGDDVNLLEIEAEDAAIEEVPGSFKIAWQSIGTACKQLLVKHFYGAMKLTEIAEESAKNPASIRKQKERCLEKLKKLMIEHLDHATR